MSQEDVEVVRNGIAAWNQRDADLWLSYAAPEIEWLPAGMVENPSAPGPIRTADLSLRRRALYPLSYGRRRRREDDVPASQLTAGEPLPANARGRSPLP